MTTLNAIVDEIKARQEAADDFSGFINDWAGRYDISNAEAERIATRAANLADFEAIWSNEDWWTDANN